MSIVIFIFWFIIGFLSVMCNSYTFKREPHIFIKDLRGYTLPRSEEFVTSLVFIKMIGVVFIMINSPQIGIPLLIGGAISCFIFLFMEDLLTPLYNNIIEKIKKDLKDEL